MKPDAASWTSRVYWLGGASGAGKSTMSRRLAAKHDMALYATDEAMADHGRRCRVEDCPRLEAFRRMSMDERWVTRSPQTMLETFHWYHGEAFHLIVEDLVTLAQDRRVIAEGFRLLPHMVRTVLHSPRQSLWLIPTQAFRRSAFEARGTLWDIPDRTGAPEVALRNLLERDHLFGERLRRQTSDLGLASIIVDGSLSEDLLFSAVESHFMGVTTNRKRNDVDC